MSGLFTSSRHLVWDTEIPFEDMKRKSPVFYFQNSEWLFELMQDVSFYYLYMVSISQLKVVQPFEVTFYIVNKGSALLYQTNKFVRSQIPIPITYFNAEILNNDKNLDLRNKGRIRIAMIISDEVGSTLRLTSEKEIFRDVAVGTNDELGTTSSNCGHSTLEILSDDFSKLLDDDLYQDVELKCEDHTFNVHKCVLSTRSKVFLAMLQSDMIEGQTAKIEVKDMNSDVCNLLLQYMYTGKPPELTPENAKSAYEAGDRYNVGGLMEPCAKFLIRNLTPENACEMLILADAHSDQHFKEIVIEYILDRNIPRKDDWQDFSSCHPILANQVLYKFYKLHDKK